MPARTTLRKRILRLVLGMLTVVSLTISGAVWYSTDSQVREQITHQLDVASEIVRNTLALQETQLVQAAQVLTADFGFKQAIASSDTETIRSMLQNHGERIDADLIAIVSLDGTVVASTSPEINAGTSFAADALLEKAVRENGVASFLALGENAYQLILLPVKAPNIIGVAMIGFRMDDTLLKNLRKVSRLDVTLTFRNDQASFKTLSSLPASRVTNALYGNSTTPGFRLPFLSINPYVTQALSLPTDDESGVRILVSASVDEFYEQFDALKFEILFISIAGISISLLAATIFSRNISLPLQQLADAARSVAHGDYRVQVNAGKSSQEVYELNAAFAAMQHDVHVREERIVFQSQHDTLTGLLNRQHIIDLISERIEANDIAQPCLVIAINTLDFRVINEMYGYESGDDYLREVARRLLAHTGADSLCARLNADEFLVFMPLTQPREIAVSALERVLVQPYRINNSDVRAHFRLATAHYPDDSQNACELLNKADVAIDVARQRKINVFHYEHGIEQARQQRLQIINDLRQALTVQDGQLMMFYQPKICMQTGEASRFEALIRWIHPVRGFIPPDHFIQIAEQSGLIEALTDFVVATVIVQLGEWQRAGLHYKVAVNLSARDVARTELLDFILVELARAELPRESLSIEITESDIMSEPEKAISLLQRYRSEGISVAIDDFGTGFSSLSQLRNMPVSQLKIDKGFVLQLADNPNDRIIVQSTIELAHRFGLEVVAEGVENSESLAYLQSWGCEWAQGYLFGKPMKPADIPGWMATYAASGKKIAQQRA